MEKNPCIFQNQQKKCGEESGVCYSVQITDTQLHQTASSLLQVRQPWDMAPLVTMGVREANGTSASGEKPPACFSKGLRAYLLGAPRGQSRPEPCRAHSELPLYCYRRSLQCEPICMLSSTALSWDPKHQFGCLWVLLAPQPGQILQGAAPCPPVQAPVLMGVWTALPRAPLTARPSLWSPMLRSSSLAWLSSLKIFILLFY